MRIVDPAVEATWVEAAVSVDIDVAELDGGLRRAGAICAAGGIYAHIANTSDAPMAVAVGRDMGCVRCVQVVATEERNAGARSAAPVVSVVKPKPRNYLGP